MNIVYQPFINQLYRSILKPFSGILPSFLKIGVNGTFTVKPSGGLPFRMLTNPTNAVTKFLFWGGVEGFEYNSVRIFSGLVKDSKVFFDIGANIGYYSLIGSSISDEKTEVYAFEPMPSIYECLNENCLINHFQNIRTFQIALSNEIGEATFYAVVNPKFAQLPQLTGDGGLSKSHSGKISKINFQVKTTTLDAFVAEHLGDKKIDLIKLDTEANEHRVLMGATTVLGNHRPIIQCEILKNQIESELQEILKPFNYLYFRATNEGLVQVKTFTNNTSDFVDYYLVPAEKRALVTVFENN